MEGKTAAHPAVAGSSGLITVSAMVGDVRMGFVSEGRVGFGREEGVGQSDVRKFLSDQKKDAGSSLE